MYRGGKTRGSMSSHIRQALKRVHNFINLTHSVTIFIHQTSCFSLHVDEATSSIFCLLIFNDISYTIGNLCTLLIVLWIDRNMHINNLLKSNQLPQSYMLVGNNSSLLFSFFTM